METLDLLEEALADYEGTLLLVSHDRDFLDRLVTSTVVFEGGGKVTEYAGGYSDWLAQRPPPPQAVGSPPERARAANAPAPRPRGFDAKLQRELDRLPEKMARVEAGIGAVEAKLADAGLFARDHAGFTRLTRELERLRGDLLALEERWLELEGQREQSALTG
jgi:ATP-binding cassette subfamily F protein uup